MLNLVLVKRRCICSNVLQSLENLAEVINASRIVVVRNESKCAKCSCMVSAFIIQISTVTKDVLHGEP